MKPAPHHNQYATAQPDIGDGIWCSNRTFAGYWLLAVATTKRIPPAVHGAFACSTATHWPQRYAAKNAGKRKLHNCVKPAFAACFKLVQACP